MVVLTTLCLLYSCSNISQDNLGPEIKPITITEDGTVEITNFVADRDYAATVMQHPDYNNAKINNEDWPAEDWFKFVLIDKNRKKVVERTFRSSYGFFTIDFIDLDGDATKEVIFILGQGRGTSVRSETLTIERFDGYGLEQVFSTSYSGHYDCGRGFWTYKRRYLDTDKNGTTDLEMVLTYDPLGAAESFWGLPKEKRKTFRWSALGKGILVFDSHR